jgi:hypothetical protein
MQQLAEAYLLNVQRYVQMQDAIADVTTRYQDSKDALQLSIENMESNHPQLEEARRYVGYIDVFIQSLVGITTACKFAGEWVAEYIKGWKESVEGHKQMLSSVCDGLLKEQSDLVRRTDFAFVTLRELRDYDPKGTSLESYKKLVKDAAEIALRKIENVRIQ